MKTYLKIIIIIEFSLSGIFLLNSASDIQLGFGLVFILMGLNSIYQFKK